jgi:flagellar motor switch protein FliM
LIELFDDASLLLLLDGPFRQRAAVVIDPVIVGALIQQQTMGHVLPDDGGQARPMTTTDAAICAPFLDAILQRAAALPEAESDQRLIKDYRFGARAEDSRLLQLAMDAPLYHVIQMEIDIDRGNRQGKMVLCMPVPDASMATQDTDAFEDATIPESDPKIMPSFAKTVPDLQIDLSLVLTQILMPLNKISSLKVGDTVALENASFDEIEIQTIEGRKVGKGTLGQLNGYRAVRVAHGEHKQHEPRRRAEDRAGLQQPDLMPLGSIHDDIGTGESLTAQFAEVLAEQNASGQTAMAENPDFADLPDMSDILDFDSLDLPDVAQG